MGLANTLNHSYIFDKSPINRYKTKKKMEFTSADLKNLKETINTIQGL